MTSPAIDRRYPERAVIDLLDGPLLTPVTAAALHRRIAARLDKRRPVILSDDQLKVLTAIAARLLPQADRANPIDLADAFHDRLAVGSIGDGWRYDGMPPDAESYRRGLDLVEQAATGRFGCAFEASSAADQDALLRDIQFGRIGEWREFSSARWFEELLAALVDIYYSNPIALGEIGYVGMADARGWQDVGPGARAPHEPEPLATPGGGS